MTITINSRPLRSVLGRLAGELERPRALNAKVARHMRDYVRQTITIQGRGKPFAPLSDLYKRKSGKFKALLGLRSRIEAGWDDSGAWVFFKPRSGDTFSIDQITKGWSQGPFEMTGSKKMVIAGPRNAKPIFFKRRKGFSVPGRQIWPGYVEAQREVAEVARAHVNDFVRKL